MHYAFLARHGGVILLLDLLKSKAVEFSKFGDGFQVRQVNVRILHSTSPDLIRAAIAMLVASD
jgi:hypothetical protein